MSSYVLFTRTDRRSRFFRLVISLATKLSRTMERHRAVAALSQMSDHQLRDIGITRGEIEHAIDHGRDFR
ncbi:DUF1127 domain-containing protein [Dongia sp.]|uniref:DUF1127 domain-containing protein n=1 Tax=Dongia sp. TaxID=1977262 RepID=UPI0035B4E3B8